MMGRIKSAIQRYAAWVAVAAVIVVSTIYTILNFNDSTGEYRTAFMSSLAATLLGLIVGIPLALKVNRSQATAAEERSALKHASEESERRDRVLRLIEKELAYNAITLADRTTTKDGSTSRDVSLPPLKQDLWETFSDGGELTWIRDPDLLDAIAEAYYHIRGIMFLEEQYFVSIHYPGGRFSHPEKLIRSYLENQDRPAVRAIQGALFAIGEARDVIAGHVLDTGLLPSPGRLADKSVR